VGRSDGLYIPRQVGMTVNRQGHDKSTGDNLVAAEAKGVLHSCSKAVCSRLARQRECSQAPTLPPVTRQGTRGNKTAHSALVGSVSARQMGLEAQIYNTDVSAPVFKWQGSFKGNANMCE